MELRLTQNQLKGNLFVAIKGKKNDGHNYINQCLKRCILIVLSKNI